MDKYHRDILHLHASQLLNASRLLRYVRLTQKLLSAALITNSTKPTYRGVGIIEQSYNVWHHFVQCQIFGSKPKTAI